MSRWTLSELAQAVGAQAHGDDTVLILGVCGVDSPVQAGRIAMAETSEHLAALRGGAVAAILHGPELVLDAPGLIHGFVDLGPMVPAAAEALTWAGTRFGELLRGIPATS